MRWRSPGATVVAQTATAATAVAVAALLGGCTSTDPAPSAGAGGTTESAAPVELTLMSFNIEYGGRSVDFDSVPKAVEAAGADVVAIQEAYAQLPQIADALGWDYYDPRTQVVSRFPLLSPPGGPGDPVYVEVEPGRYLAVFDVHLDSSKYGPNATANGRPAREVLAREEGRVGEITPIAQQARQLQADGVPTVVMGDFNSPSFQDWTQATVGLRDHVTYPLRWPVSVELAAAGLVDLYRAQNPDPVTDPGITWPADRPFVSGYNPADRGDPADRIDMIWAGGGISASDVRIVGEKGGDGVDVAVSPWPTDHRAVVADVSLTPADVGPIVGPVSRIVDQGDNVTLLFAPGDTFPSRVTVDDAPPLQVAIDDPAAGRVEFSTADLRPATYTATLRDDAGQSLATSDFTVVAPGAGPSLTTDRTTYRPGQPVDVTWVAAPGNKWDWVGIYRRDADPNKASYLVWDYTGASIDGSTTLDGGANASVWPLKPGRYSVYLLLDDSYVKAAQADFTVAGRPLQEP